mgnify:CR=1 FL=1
MKATLPNAWVWVLLALIIAALKSAACRTHAFTRDGGRPFSDALRRVNPASKSPSVAVWFAAISAASSSLSLGCSRRMNRQ